MMCAPADGHHDRNVHGLGSAQQPRGLPVRPYGHLLEVSLASEQPAPRGLVGLAPWRTYDQSPLAACLSAVDRRGNPSQSEYSAT
jgi:hypothetical protein